MEKYIRLEYFLGSKLDLSNLMKKKDKEIKVQHKMQDQFYFPGGHDLGFGVFRTYREAAWVAGRLQLAGLLGPRPGELGAEIYERRWKCRCGYITLSKHCTQEAFALSSAICPHRQIAEEKLRKLGILIVELRDGVLQFKALSLIGKWERRARK